MNELLTPAFIAGCTRFKTADAMIDASGYAIHSEADLAAIPRHDWDAFIRVNSGFPSWDAMLGVAAAQWQLRRMGLVIDR